MLRQQGESHLYDIEFLQLFHELRMLILYTNKWKTQCREQIGSFQGKTKTRSKSTNGEIYSSKRWKSSSLKGNCSGHSTFFSICNMGMWHTGLGKPKTLNFHQISSMEDMLVPWSIDQESKFSTR